MNLKKINLKIILNIIVVIFLLILPYYLFSGKLYLGGDDTRLFYSYPINFLTNVTFFSWYKVSSLGINGPNQYMFPFLVVWSFLSFIISDKAALNYLAMSLPLILGFIYFQKTIKELFSLNNNTDTEVFLGSLFYILSPILIINQLFVFLISIWLIGLIPIISYYFLKYLKTSRFIYVFISAIWCLILGQAVYSIPWLFGFILPIILGLLIISLSFNKKEIKYFIKKVIIFFGYIFFSQAFWLTGFISTYLNLGQDSFASKFLSKGFIDTFTPTIISTATGNIFYPLLGLFHRQIPFDFDWKLKDVFLEFYDKTFILNSIFIVIFIFGVLNYKFFLKNTNKKIYLFLLISFTFSLYFFTVNIGPLKDLFMLFRYIPGFIMFRNFYDKFAPGYVILYSTLISISLVMLTRKFSSKRVIILAVFLLITIINFIPVKKIVNSPLWTTHNIYKAINIPKEYLNFMDFIKNNISSTNNILSVPFGSSAYTVIKEDKSNNIYAGVSPIKIFSGVNDISGHLSFNFTKEADIVDNLIVKRRYAEFNKVLFEHNINYILITRNVPKELGNSYLFNPDLFNIQDQKFINAIVSKELRVSSAKNYALYKTKKSNSLINSKNVYFKKVSEVKYIIYLKSLSNPQELSFIDSYHVGWKLFIQKNPSLSFCFNPVKNSFTGSVECKAESKLVGLNDLAFLLEKPIFSSTHGLIYNYANKWEIDPEYIKKNLSPSYYKVNNDGSISVELVLYFVPQNYFYLGIFLSLIVFLSGAFYLLIKKYEKNK